MAAASDFPFALFPTLFAVRANDYCLSPSLATGALPMSDSRPTSNRKLNPSQPTSSDGAAPRPHLPLNAMKQNSGGRPPRDHEPMSLAEEIAEQHDRTGKMPADELAELTSKVKETNLGELQRLSMPELMDEARRANIEEVDGVKRQELIF